MSDEWSQIWDEMFTIDITLIQNMKSFVKREL